MLPNARFLRFLIVGGINTAVNYGIYALLLFAGLGHLAAITLSFAVGLAISFRAHARFVFQGGGYSAFALYVGSWLLLYALNVTILDLLVRRGVDEYLAGAILVPPFAILAYFVLRHVVFRAAAPAKR
jgi:putative flippase GtrA